METPTSRQRFYYNGKLTKTSSPRDIATLRQFLNNIEADWSRNIRPALQPGQFDYNQATEVRFIYRRNWFVLAQTDGAEQRELFAVPELTIDFSLDRALAALNIQREEFSHMDGNALGYAKPGRIIAVSPLAPYPQKTALHEVAHIVHGHLESATMTDSEATPRNIREVEAEGTAYLLLAVLGYPESALAFSRGYIQSWLGDGNDIPERSAQKIFKAADTILKAGKPEKAEAN